MKEEGKYEKGRLNVFGAISVFLSTVVISFTGQMLTAQYNKNQIEMNKNKDLAEFVPKLLSTDIAEQKKAVIGLSLYGEKAVLPMTQLWEGFTDCHVKRLVVTSIAIIGKPAIPILLQKYNSEQETPVMREWALLTLMMLRYDKTSELIDRALLNSRTDYDVLRSAVMGVGYLRMKEHVPTLIGIINAFKDREEYADLVNNAVFGLGLVGGDEVLSTLEQLAVSHASSVTRIEAIKSIGCSKSGSRINALANIQRKNTDSNVKSYAWYVQQRIAQSNKE